MDEKLLLNQLSELKSMIEGSRPLFQEYVQDKDIPLQERWKTFKDHGPMFLTCDPFIIHLQELKHAELNDREVFDTRHVTWTFSDIILMIEENREEDGADCYFSKVDVDRLKEEMLGTGRLGFTVDW